LGRSSFFATLAEQSALIESAQLHRCDMQTTLSTAKLLMYSVRCAILMPNADMLSSLSQPRCSLLWIWILRYRFHDMFKVVIPELSIATIAQACNPFTGITIPELGGPQTACHRPHGLLVTDFTSVCEWTAPSLADRSNHVIFLVTQKEHCPFTDIYLPRPPLSVKNLHHCLRWP
jgi:hypothetical protein